MHTDQLSRQSRITQGHAPAHEANEPPAPEPSGMLAEAVNRARRSGDRGVAVVKRGSRVVSAKPCRSVPVGVIHMTATADPDLQVDQSNDLA